MRCDAIWLLGPASTSADILVDILSNNFKVYCTSSSQYKRITSMEDTPIFHDTNNVNSGRRRIGQQFQKIERWVTVFATFIRPAASTAMRINRSRFPPGVRRPAPATSRSPSRPRSAPHIPACPAQGSCSSPSPQQPPSKPSPHLRPRRFRSGARGGGIRRHRRRAQRGRDWQATRRRS
jgi:hypothetical protein